jgi:hypothetical protein
MAAEVMAAGQPVCTPVCTVGPTTDPLAAIRALAALLEQLPSEQRAALAALLAAPDYSAAGAGGTKPIR